MSPLVGAAIALVVGVFANIAAAENGNPNNSINPADFLIPREDLSTQGTDPFLFVGPVMDDTRPRWDEFEDALERFPTTSSCLLPEEQGKEVQDVLAFDWQAMSELHEMEICMFRVFRSLDDPKRVEQWLTSFEFVVIPISPSGRVETPSHQWSLYGAWTPDQMFSKTGAERLLPWFTLGGLVPRATKFVVSVRLSDKHEVTSVVFDPITPF